VSFSTIEDQNLMECTWTGGSLVIGRFNFASSDIDSMYIWPSETFELGTWTWCFVNDSEARISENISGDAVKCFYLFSH
jgi:hypothetical protein